MTSMQIEVTHTFRDSGRFCELCIDNQVTQAVVIVNEDRSFCEPYKICDSSVCLAQLRELIGE